MNSLMSKNDDEPRVFIDARVISGMPGGIEQVIQGLVGGLSRLKDPRAEISILTFPGHTEWIRPFAAGPCHLVEARKGPRHTTAREHLKAMRLPPSAAWAGLGAVAAKAWMMGARSDGTAERHGAQVVHTLVQPAFRTRLPSIYQVYDLQHLHFPDYFSPFHRTFRDSMYRGFCRRARRITVMSPWVRRDLALRYHLPPEKIAVVPFGSVHESRPDPSRSELEATADRFGIRGPFALYPAQTWPHKNHLALLEALAICRDRFKMKIPLVAPGRRNHFFSSISRRAKELSLEDQLLFPGYIELREVQCLYKLARMVVVPSRFEGGGMPLLEALRAGTPVACSNLPVLADLAENAALFFNPDEPSSVARAVLRLWEGASLRNRLRARGRRVAAKHTWERAARTCLALYRDVIGSQAER